MTQTTIVGAGAQKRELSQFFTPDDLAERIVEWGMQAGADEWRPQYILEPSAGRGALVRPMLKLQANVFAVELDPDNVEALKRLTSNVIQADFLACDFLPDTYDIAIMNPPFENGQAERHIMHALKSCERVIAHVPLTTLEGKARRESLWSKVRLDRLAVCASRPKYGAKGGATAMCTIDVSKNVLFDCSWDDVTVEVWP